MTIPWYQQFFWDHPIEVGVFCMVGPFIGVLLWSAFDEKYWHNHRCRTCNKHVTKEGHWCYSRGDRANYQVERLRR